MRQMRFFAFFPAMTRRFFMAGLALIVAEASPVAAQDLMPTSAALTDPAKQVIVKSGNFMVRDHLVIDLRNGVEWMRCSVGQVWNGSNCEGEALQLTQEDAAKAIIIANE